MSNKTYDVLKWVALIVLPALATFYSTLGDIWGLPYKEEIPQTITAIDLFIGALIGLSTIKYNKTELLDEYYQEEENAGAFETDEREEL